MTTLADDVVPDQLWTLVAPCCQPCLGRHTAAGIAPSPIATASPRSGIWRGPPRRGGYSQRVNLAVAQRRHVGAA
jgi:hypothetical protein